jgi:hypothetical protein
MVHLFEDTNLCAMHAKRVTISETLVSIIPIPFWFVKVLHKMNFKKKFRESVLLLGINLLRTEVLYPISC